MFGVRALKTIEDPTFPKPRKKPVDSVVFADSLSDSMLPWVRVGVNSA